MSNWQIKFTKDKVWKRFLLFEIDRDDSRDDESKHSIQKKGKSAAKRKSAKSRGFTNIQKRFVSTYDTLFLHFPFQNVMTELHLFQLVDDKLRGTCKKNGRLLEQTEETETYEVPEVHAVNFMEIISGI